MGSRREGYRPVREAVPEELRFKTGVMRHKADDRASCTWWLVPDQRRHV